MSIKEENQKVSETYNAAIYPFNPTNPPQEAFYEKNRVIKALQASLQRISIIHEELEQENAKIIQEHMLKRMVFVEVAKSYVLEYNSFCFNYLINVFFPLKRFSWRWKKSSAILPGHILKFKKYFGSSDKKIRTQINDFRRVVYNESTKTFDYDKTFDAVLNYYGGSTDCPLFEVFLKQQYSIDWVSQYVDLQRLPCFNTKFVNAANALDLLKIVISTVSCQATDVIAASQLPLDLNWLLSLEYCDLVTERCSVYTGKPA